MNILGVRLNLLIGPDPVALPAPIRMLEALAEVEVSHSDRERSGFRLTFTVGRSGPTDLIDYELILNPLLQVHSRVVLTAIFDIRPRVIMDGLVTRRDLVSGDRPGEGRLVLSGHDLSIALDRKYNPTEHINQPEAMIAAKIAASYPQYAMVPNVRQPPLSTPPLNIEHVPQQTGTDWDYLEEMAGRFGFVTYVKSGPVPLQNALYWGPPIAPELPQPALSANMGPVTNVSGLSFTQDGLAITMVKSSVKDALTGQTMPVFSVVPTRPPLGLVPSFFTGFPSLREVGMETTGLNSLEALGRAQAKLDSSSDNVLTVSGTLDSTRYNDVLQARSLVDLRGAGATHDGTYLVRSVTHKIGRGAYTQDFTLSRAELGAKLPLVRVA